MKIVFSEKCLEYKSPGHPESPERVRLAWDYLRDRFAFIEPTHATEADVLLVHSEEHLKDLKNLEFYDADSPQYPDIYEYASLSAGGAITAAEENAFSLTRPPGHHAGRSSVAGFCYLNSVAIAVRRLARKTLIVDIDAHHGNGTEEIFLGDPSVIYVSLHASPLYPGTGLQSRKNCFNFPLAPRCGDAVYMKTLEAALESIDLDGIEQIAVSAGFDGYETDPLASLDLTGTTYRRIGERLSGLSFPLFAVLEGGYDGTTLGQNIEHLLRGLTSAGS
jgi:acetoin utilization deacetylase AcuC-like enzyme